MGRKKSGDTRISNVQKAREPELKRRYKQEGGEPEALEGLLNEIERAVMEEKEKELEVANRELSKREDSLNKKQTKLEEREAHAQELEDSLKKRKSALENEERNLIAAREDLSKKHDYLNERQIAIEEKELQAKNGFPELFAEKFGDFINQLKQRENECTEKFKSIEAKEEELRRRGQKLREDEIKRDEGYASERRELDEELFNLRKSAQEEIASQRVKAMDDMQKELSKKIDSVLSNLDKELAERKRVHEEEIQKERGYCQQEMAKLTEERAELDGLKEKLDYQQRILEARERNLKEHEGRIDERVEDRIHSEREGFRKIRSDLEGEISSLRDDVRASNSLLNAFEWLKQKLGGEDPAVVILRLRAHEETIKNLRNEINERPTREMQEEFDRLKSEIENIKLERDRLDQENKGLRAHAVTVDDLEMQINELSEKNDSLSGILEIVKGHNDELMYELKRLQVAYEKGQERDSRIKDIETPYIQKRPDVRDGDVDELEWLDGIDQACEDYGLKFPRRILHAFHTALKTSEWSPITVLAGVSGTGKSELPRLYSHFGGINFLSLSVQPNWDSQESMLGFFNSIDNKFDAQPVLRFLAQSQRPFDEKEYEAGLKETMNLILLDEMNLAHVELYFAEFLSKLELRRGCGRNDVPNLEVKLGAGMEPYKLPLGRNVLWVGTINQDETTKSLSDKVLDRGIIINFPRPTSLEGRKLKQLGEQAPLLSRGSWDKWWCKESVFKQDEIEPYKRFVEEMNDSLSKVGRALGHRVWQSIEYYMSNYPDVLYSQNSKDEERLKKAMRDAFEDQLVQKVMPKLRGIETRGRSKSECLDKIKDQLVSGEYQIVEDFDLACELGYGQFMWCSANYLKSDDYGGGETGKEEKADK